MSTLKFYNPTTAQWEYAVVGKQGPQGETGRYTISETAPTGNLVNGELWFKSSTAQLYFYYDSYWIETSTSYLGPTGPTGPQGPQGPQGIPGTFAGKGDTGDKGDTGATGVVSVTSPITNTGTSTAANIGIDQTGLTLAQTQITGLVTALNGKANLDSNNSFTGNQSMTGTLSVNISGTGTLNLGDATISKAPGSGFTFTSGITNIAYLGVGASGSSSIPLNIVLPLATSKTIIRGAVSQSANLQEWQQSDGTVQTFIGGNGFFVSKNGAALGGLNSGFSSTAVSIGSGTATNKGLVIQGVASQTANLQEWQESTGGIPTAVNNFGQMRVRTYGLSISDTAFAAASAYPTEKAIVARGVNGQSADLQQWQDSAGTVLSSVAYTGQLRAPSIVGSNFQITSGGVFSNGTATAIANTQAYFLTTSAANTGVVVRGASSQSANLQEWQNSAGTVLVNISSAGAMLVQQLTLAAGGIIGSGGQTSMGVSTSRNVFLNSAVGSYGGGQGVTFMGNVTTAPTSNPTDGGILYVEGGALKYRGSSGTVTILGPA